MKNLLRTFSICVIIAWSMQAEAQVKFGVKAGLNINNISQNFKESSYESDTKMRLAYNFGATVDYELNEVLSLQSGLMFTSKGFSYDIEKDEDGIEGYYRTTYNYLEIPINFAYKINEFQIYAGPYFAFGIGGKEKYDYKDDDGDSEKGEYKLKPVFGEVGEGDLGEDEGAYYGLDYGLSFGVGYQAGPILINAGYSLGLANLTPAYKGDDGDRKDFKQSNRVISISASYFFGQ